MPTKHEPLLQNISCHAFNADLSLCALSSNSSDVLIYSTKGSEDLSKWELIDILEEHGGHVCSIEWNKQENSILTAGHDRNAYVWKEVDGFKPVYDKAGKPEFDKSTGKPVLVAGKVWKPTLVILRINRAATSSKWSPDGKKFAVTSGAKCVPICHFEESNNWYISKMIKKHKSTVTSVAWSPNSKYVVTGSTDGKCRIFSAFIEGIDSPSDDGFGAVWPKQHEFGECLAEFDSGPGWVNAVAWSQAGDLIAFAGHGSTITVVEVKTGKSSTTFLKTLPATILEFIANDVLLFTGFDPNPRLLVNQGGVWHVDKSLDPETDGEKADAKKAGPAHLAAFKKADTEGKVLGGGEEEEPIKTFHKNFIADVKLHGNGKFTTGGIDGRIYHWVAK